MPELPEVEVLVRSLAPLLKRKRIRAVQVNRPRILRPTSVRKFTRQLSGAEFRRLRRRGKYLVFTMYHPARAEAFPLVGHLGMTGRMYLLSAKQPAPKHAAVVLNLGRVNFVFEDTRYFGRLTLEVGAIQKLGPEPFSPDFTIPGFAKALRQSRQPIKVKLLDQRLLAGVGNIYASEALFKAGISPKLAARSLRAPQVERLWGAIREVLDEAIRFGSTVPLNFAGAGRRDSLFYYGTDSAAPSFYEERLRVYDKDGQPCRTCGTNIKRLIQAARSSFFCPKCQRR